MESKLKSLLLTWKLRSLRVLVAGILIFLALFLTYLNIRGYYRNPDSFTVMAVFPVGLSDVMEMAKQVKYMPNGLVTIPGEVSDLVGTNIAEAYRVVTCFPENESGTFFGKDVCGLELYVWRGDGLPTLYVKIEEPLAFVDQTSYKMLTRPASYNKYYTFFSSNRGTPEVFGNVVVQTFHKTPILNFLFSSVIFFTSLSLFLAWCLYQFTIWHVKEYRADNRVHD